ncbi:MAG: hypothetical protein N3D18_05425 [Roseococcus sp.]|nr:hypothetical protein [Roseococcus sp.]
MSEALAAALAEAWEQGEALAPLPAGMAPLDVPAGEEVAAALVERLGQPVIGIRLVSGPGGAWIAGPLLGPRLLRAGTPVALPALRHPRVSAAVIGVLAAPLAEAPPSFSALHPAVDVAADRYRDGPADAAQAVADLASLGLLVAGKRAPGALPERAAARIGPTGTRHRPVEAALAPLMEQAAAAARRWGGLPAGALLVVAGLGGLRAAAPGKWSAAIAGVGRVNVLLTGSAGQPAQQGEPP